MATDCKSVGVNLRRFKSYSLHHLLVISFHCKVVLFKINQFLMDFCSASIVPFLVEEGALCDS
jgi:hypothetical protein